MTLSDFFSVERGRQSKLARTLGCSKGYLSQIANGEKFPSREFALRIEKATKGKVKAAIVLGLEAA